jgi:hypothetical protein
MPTPPMTEAVMAEAVAMVRKHGSISAAAIAEGIPRQTLQTRVRRYEGLHGRFIASLGPEPLNSTKNHYPDEKPRVRVAANTAEMRVLAIGDVHAGPGMPTDHLAAIGRYAVSMQPSHVVQIGDFGDWSSCQQHDGNETLKGRLKPSFTADEDAVHSAYDALYSPMERGGLRASLHQTDGNHEARVDRFVNMHPELYGDWDVRVRQIPARFGVDRKEYGDWLFLGGVGFIHHPNNILGRAYGGKYPENQIANDATFSIVSGHTHKPNTIHRSKIGPNNKITILNLGTAMPTAYVPSYAQWSTTGWGYGVFLLTIAGGRITSHTFTSIDDLMRGWG